MILSLALWTAVNLTLVLIGLRWKALRPYAAIVIVIYSGIYWGPNHVIAKILKHLF